MSSAQRACGGGEGRHWRSSGPECWAQGGHQHGASAPAESPAGPASWETEPWDAEEALGLPGTEPPWRKEATPTSSQQTQPTMGGWCPPTGAFWDGPEAGEGAA